MEPAFNLRVFIVTPHRVEGPRFQWPRFAHRSTPAIHRKQFGFCTKNVPHVQPDKSVPVTLCCAFWALQPAPVLCTAQNLMTVVSCTKPTLGLINITTPGPSTVLCAASATLTRETNRRWHEAEREAERSDVGETRCFNAQKHAGVAVRLFVATINPIPQQSREVVCDPKNNVKNVCTSIHEGYLYKRS